LELEDEFAFSLTESREEWEAEQQSSLEFAKEMDAKIAERQRAESQGDADASAWRTSYVDWDSAFSPDAPRSMVVLAIGFRVAELVTDLKDRPQGRPHLDSLNQAYAAFRLAQSDLAERSAAGELAQRLEQVARAFPDLVGKSADLQSRLDEMLRRTAGQVDR
jgi:transketolase